MYLRFTSPDAISLGLRGGKAVHCGIFGPAYRVRRDKAYPQYLRLAVRDELLWFEDKLPIPASTHFRVPSKGWWYYQGICWFKSDAQEMIRRAYGLAALLAEADVLISDLHTDRPGQILYKDEFQIIAKPAAATPTVWG